MTLEERIQRLERKTSSLSYTMLALVAVLVAVAFMQYQVNLSLKRQISQGASHAE